MLDNLALTDGELFHTRKGKAMPWPKPAVPLADTHAHLTSFHTLSPAQALARAALAGVRLLVVPIDALTDFVPDSSRQPFESLPTGKPTKTVRTPEQMMSFIYEACSGAQELMKTYRACGFAPPTFEGYDLLDEANTDFPLCVRFVIGVHPYGAGAFDDACRERIRTLAQHKLCVGIGEIGLDYTCDVSRDVQMQVFEEQLTLAREFDLAVELHIRNLRDDEACEAHRDALELLSHTHLPKRGCDLHCYTGNADTMKPFTELGCRIAFGGAATFKKSDEIREAAVACPSSCIITETDCPYMAPEPLRGQECEPAMVAYSAACVATTREAQGVAPERDTYEALWKNACELFGF